MRTRGKVVETLEILCCEQVRRQNMSCVESTSYVGGNDFVCELKPLQWQLRRQSETGEIEDDVVAPVCMGWGGDGLISCQ